MTAGLHLTVSTIIPTYNRAHLIERALASVVPQCEAGDEVVVVDDGSTDGTPELIERYGPPVRLLRTPHAGAGAARNAGVQAARGDLVAFLDSDDEWMPGKLASQRAILEQFADVLFVFSDFGFISSSGKRQAHRLGYWRALWAPDHLSWEQILGSRVSGPIRGLDPSTPAFNLYVGSLYPHLMNHWAVSTITVTVRKEAAGDALRFPDDIPLYEDLECCARLAARGKAAFMECDTAWNHGHDGPHLSGVDEVASARAAVTVLSRVWGADSEYLARHRAAYEQAVDAHRLRGVRRLLVLGRTREARAEIAQLYRPAPLERFLARLPRPVLLAALAGRRSLRRMSGR